MRRIRDCLNEFALARETLEKRSHSSRDLAADVDMGGKLVWVAMCKLKFV
jgi:hypothetical protein